VDSDDLSVIVSESGNDYVVLQSPPEVEEDKPRYKAVARFESAISAEDLAAALRLTL
jgi:hypothetical protein